MLRGHEARAFPHRSNCLDMRYWRAVARAWTALRRPDDGSAAVELAVVLPVLLLLVMGVVDFGHIFVTSVAVANAARSGAQYGAQNTATSGDNTGMNNAATTDFPAALGTLTVNSQRQCRCSSGDAPVTGVACATLTCGTYGEPRVFVEVTANQSVNLLFRYPGFAATIPVVRTATVRVQ